MVFPPPWHIERRESNIHVVETSLGNNIFYNHYYGSYFDYKYLFDVLNFYINLLSRLRPWRAALRDFRLSLQSPLQTTPQTTPYKRSVHGAKRVGIASQCPF